MIEGYVLKDPLSGDQLPPVDARLVIQLQHETFDTLLEQDRQATKQQIKALGILALETTQP